MQQIQKNIKIHSQILRINSTAWVWTEPDKKPDESMDEVKHNLNEDGIEKNNKLRDFHFASIILFVEAFRNWNRSVERKTNGAENLLRKKFQQNFERNFRWLARWVMKKEFCAVFCFSVESMNLNQLPADCGFPSTPNKNLGNYACKNINESKFSHHLPTRTKKKSSLDLR